MQSVHWDAPLYIHLSFVWGIDVRLVGAYVPFGYSACIRNAKASIWSPPPRSFYKIKTPKICKVSTYGTVHFWSLEPQVDESTQHGPTSASNLIHVCPLQVASGGAVMAFLSSRGMANDSHVETRVQRVSCLKLMARLRTSLRFWLNRSSSAVFFSVWRLESARDLQKLQQW